MVKENQQPNPPVELEGVVERKGREKVLVAIDLSNLHCQVKSMHEGRSISGDYAKIIDEISPGNDNTAMCFAAIASPLDDLTSYSNTLRLHNFLRATGFMVHTIERKNGKADGDVLLAVKSMEAMSLANYDRFVLVSADGDFYPLLEHFRQRGIKVTVASIESHISIKLKRCTDQVIDLHEWAMNTIDSNGNQAKLNIKRANRNALDPLENSLNKMKANFQDMSKRRDDFNDFTTAIATSISMMNGKEMKVARGILTTLRECMETFDPRSLDKEDMSVLMKVSRGLKRKDPNVNLNVEIRNRFIMRSGSL